MVLIEGTFADVWSAQRTVTYYSFLAMAQYLGAAFGKHSELISILSYSHLSQDQLSAALYLPAKVQLGYRG